MSFRYANGQNSVRVLQVDGNVVNAKMTFPSTGGYPQHNSSISPSSVPLTPSPFLPVSLFYLLLLSLIILRYGTYGSVSSGKLTAPTGYHTITLIYESNQGSTGCIFSSSLSLSLSSSSSLIFLVLTLLILEVINLDSLTISGN